MTEFKARADAMIKARYGIEVEHHCAVRNGEKLTYEKMFYHKPVRRERDGVPILGFPIRGCRWCVQLKTKRLQRIPAVEGPLVQKAQNSVRDVEVSNNKFLTEHRSSGADINTVTYLGIASDEPERIARHKSTSVMPLVDIGWDEAYCRTWCEENGLLSPIYSTSSRGGCWFCHFQGVDQLLILRHTYPELWSLLMKWDLDSPVTFNSSGYTIHDFDKRFALEDDGVLVPGDRRFRWKQVVGTERG